MSKITNVKAPIKVSLMDPILNDAMIEAAVFALKNERFLRGNSVTEFEESFARFVGTKHALAVNSGTNALHLSLIACGIGHNDIVVTTPATFIATANAIRYVGAIVKFADISLNDYNIDVTKLEKILIEHRGKVKAVIPVHLYGNPASMDPIMELQERFKFELIEDACQAHGAMYNGKMTGNFGRASAFSFYPSKNVSVAGDGGMITTNDDEIANKVQILRDVGRSKNNSYEHEVIGYTARMNTVNAAIGKVQMKYLRDWITHREQIAGYYYDKIDRHGIILPSIEPNKKSAWHLFVIRNKRRDDLKNYLTNQGIECGIHYPIPVHLQPPYRALGYSEGMFPNAERWCREILSIPLHQNLTFEQADYVIDSILKFTESN